MSLLVRGLPLLAIISGTSLVQLPVPVARRRSPEPVPSHEAGYTPEQKEHYLSADQIGWVRPGLRITIVGISNVAAGQKPAVEVTLTDKLGQPVDRLGAITPGPASASFVLARWDAEPRQYFAYTTRVVNG